MTCGTGRRGRIDHGLGEGGDGRGPREKKVSGRSSRHVLLKTPKWIQHQRAGRHFFIVFIFSEVGAVRGVGGITGRPGSTTSETNLDVPHIKAGGVALLFHDTGTRRYLIMYWSETGTCSPAAAAATFLLNSTRGWHWIKQTKSNLCYFSVLFINSNKC